MQYSFSRVDLFRQCKRKFKYRYVDKLKLIPDDAPDNPLIIGRAMHKAIETDIENAIQEYQMAFPIITDLHINEIMKLESMVPKVKSMLEGATGLIHEFRIITSDFIGFIDLLEYQGMDEDGRKVFNMYDFKYSNAVDRYKASAQLHVYKYHFEVMTGDVIQNMYYIMIPKTSIRQKKDEDLRAFRMRLTSTLEVLQPTIVPVEYEPDKVEEFLETIYFIKQETEFPKTVQPNCRFCEFQKICEMGQTYMILPSTTRRPIGTPKKRKIWIYGAPFSGKTTMLDSAPNPLNLNTDENIQFVTMPYIHIKNIVTVTGRSSNTKLAWEVFKETIEELEKKQNEFQTIIVDLLEDMYESCRLYMYDKLKITHESDDSFRAWDKVRTEFLSTLRRLFSLEYENIVMVSHEDMSKDITKKSGDKITAIKPNLNDKVASKIAGMVDIVARVVVEDDGSRTLNFKSNEVVFGGGRLHDMVKTIIPLDWNELMAVYEVADGGKPFTPPAPKTGRGRKKSTVESEPEVKEEPKKEKAFRTKPEPEKVTEKVEEIPNVEPETDPFPMKDDVEPETEPPFTVPDPPQPSEDDPKPRKRRRVRD